MFALIATGLLNEQIAAELETAEKTIKQDQSRVMDKLEAESLEMEIPNRRASPVESSRFGQRVKANSRWS